MSSNSGVGAPQRFRCSKCRRAPQSFGGFIEHVTLTGEKRPAFRSKSARGSTHEREYICTSCGHYGWSKHIDLETKEVNR